jgi:hypothetical protein
MRARVADRAAAFQPAVRAPLLSHRPWSSVPSDLRRVRAEWRRRFTRQVNVVAFRLPHFQ